MPAWYGIRSKARMLASGGTMTMRLYYTGSYSGRTGPLSPLSRQGLIHSRHIARAVNYSRLSFPPTRYLISRRMRTNLAHVSPICIYMNRRGLRDWNKFGRLSELGNLYGHTSNADGRIFYIDTCTYIYAWKESAIRTQPRRAIKLYYAAICLTAKIDRK